MLHIPIVHAHDVSKQIPLEKIFSIGLKCYKEDIIMAIAQEAIIFIYVIYLPFILNA